MSNLTIHRTDKEYEEEIFFQKQAMRVMHEGILKSLDFFAYNQTLYARDALNNALIELDKCFKNYEEVSKNER
jgi:hypothetical protein